jgi:hypothetical protein
MMREFFIGINEFRDQARQALTPEDGTEGRSCSVGRGLESIALVPRRLVS